MAAAAIHCAGLSGLGSAGLYRQNPTLHAAGTQFDIAHTVGQFGFFAASMVVYSQINAGCFVFGNAGRRTAGGFICLIATPRTIDVAVCSDLTSNATGGHCTLDPDLYRSTAALLLCAWIVAFFPILSSTLVGLQSANRQLSELFTLYGATGLQRLRWLLVPSALPYFMSGLKICGGLSLIAGVTAEMVAGAAGRETGLASRIFWKPAFAPKPQKYLPHYCSWCSPGLLIYGCMELASRIVQRRWQ